MKKTIVMQPNAWANPGPLGLFAFSLTTMMLMTEVSKAVGPKIVATVIPHAYVYGGLVQLIVGVLEFLRNSLFGGVCFTSYGAFWIAWGLEHTFNFSDAPKDPDAHAVYLLCWACFTFVMWIQTFWITRALQVVFGLLWIVFALLAGGQYSPACMQVAGVVGFPLALSAFYTAVAEVTNDLQKKVVLPLGHVHVATNWGNSMPGQGAILNDADGRVALRARLHRHEAPAAGADVDLSKPNTKSAHSGLPVHEPRALEQVNIHLQS